MTSTADTAGHPDVAELSDLTEGLLPASRSEAVRRHVDGCALCADVYDSLEEIRALLTDLPTPGEMPVDVVGRIDAALAAEAHPDTATADEPTEGDTARAAGHVSRETSTDRPSGHPRAATGPGRLRRVRRRRGTVTLLGTAVAAAVLGVAVVLVQTVGGHGSGDKTPAARPLDSSAPDTFSAATLRGDVADLLRQKRSAKPSGTVKPWGVQSQDTGADSGDVGTLMTPTPSVPNCVRQGTDDTGALLAAKTGTYEGKDVFLLLMADPADKTKVTAHIIDATCVKQTSPKPGKLLLTRSYPRS
ncbi:anti-sigma factor family protein [Streptomyces sp. NPDC048566]|uniref:anti-sigma factor family protein n=1 Tax=Streptomyces sp. NPDC048566 TaxID=3365569 RepID=UPI003712A58F